MKEVYFHREKDGRTDREGEREKDKPTTSRGLSTEEDQRAVKGQRRGRKEGVFRTVCRTQIRRTDIPMRDRFSRPRDLGSLGLIRSICLLMSKEEEKYRQTYRHMYM